MIFCATGHRPQLIPQYSFSRLVELCEAFLKKHKPSLQICGGAEGFDQAMAEACLNLKVPYDVYIPFAGQESKWGAESVKRYRKQCGGARKLLLVSEGGYAKDKYLTRDKAMVDDAQEVVALLSGSSRPSGTKYTVDYAAKLGKPVLNLWGSWMKYGAV